MQTDVKQTIAVAATAQLQKYVKTTATNITKARIMAISAQASGANVGLTAQLRYHASRGNQTIKDILPQFKDIVNQNQIPIVAPLGLDKNNQTYNINGDTAASAIAKKLKSRRLILMTNVEGVYDDKKKLIPEIKPFDLENLIKWKIVGEGMIPKIENCVDAVENGVRGVVILDGRKPHSILKEIFSDKGAGTLIRK